MPQQAYWVALRHLLAPFTLTLLLVTPLFAAEVEGLYEAEVAVEGQNADQRRSAIREAFNQVLIKVSGSREVMSHAGLRQIQSKASRYVQQYRYRIVERPLVEEAEPLETVIEEPLDNNAEITTNEILTEQQRLLWVHFDAAAVNNLLHKKGVPVWGSARPSVVIWLSQERRGERFMLQPEMLPEMVAAIDEHAAQRGLSIMLPMMDMEDHIGLPVSALWGGFSEVIQQASRRYEADAVVTGQLVATATNSWQVEWSLYQDDVVEQWLGAEGEVNDVVTQGIEQLSDHLAKRYTQAANNNLSQLQVTVTEINDLASYAKVSQYFESLAMVEQALLQAIDLNQGEFQLTVRGGAEALNQGIKLGSVLERVTIKERLKPVDEPPEGPHQPKPEEHIGPTYRLR